MVQPRITYIDIPKLERSRIMNTPHDSQPLPYYHRVMTEDNKVPIQDYSFNANNIFSYHHQLPSHGWIQNNNQEHHCLQYDYGAASNANRINNYSTNISAPSPVSLFPNSNLHSFGNFLSSVMNDAQRFGNYYGKSSAYINNISTIIEEGFGENDVSELLSPSSHLQSVHYKKKTIAAEDANNNQRSEKLNQPDRSENKIRPRDTDTDDSLCCTCRGTTACLKRYCNCFAAELYCGESCSCKGCRNKEQYVDHVVSSKKRIMFHDPMAFVPKIMPIYVPPNNAENDHGKREPSPKHIFGCKCQKSKCSQKYCECYMGKVGCYGKCGCIGCKNPFGGKEAGEVKED